MARGGGLRLTIGEDTVNLDASRPQAPAPGGVRQSAEPAATPELITCVVAPGFDFADFSVA